MVVADTWREQLRARIDLSELVSRRVRLVRRGREFVGLCPFHQEKTPSFHVVADKGFYHCFGCGAHGDAISFVMETEGVSFGEALELLASRYGVVVPRLRERGSGGGEARQGADARRLVEGADMWYRARLQAPEGEAARAYLHERGLDDTLIAQFGIGFAPDNQQALHKELVAQGADEKQLVALGLFRDGGRAFFRNRITFPISDRRGHTIGFGGRYMGQPREGIGKYINSPATILFDKGQQVYNMAHAMTHVREQGSLIITEGYMDVIAFARAGLGAAVAPLGTALGEAQIQLCWRLHAEPIICFDGDTAGLRAASRVAHRVLPILRPGFSLRFAFLPPGEDPDSILMRNGRKALHAEIHQPAPLHQVLWQDALAQHPLDTPERRAALQQTLARLSRDITDKSLAREYYYALQNLFREHCRHQFRLQARPRLKTQSREYTAAANPLIQASANNNLRTRHNLQRLQQQALLAVLIHHPQLLPPRTEQIAQMTLDPPLDKMLRCIQNYITVTPAELTESGVVKALKHEGYDAMLSDVLSSKIVNIAPAAKPQGSLLDAAEYLDHVLAMADQQRIYTQLKTEAASNKNESGNHPDNHARLVQLAEEMLDGEDKIEKQINKLPVT